MLKLTYSFCRYLKIRCENVNYNKIHVKSFTHLNYRRKKCSIEHIQSIFFAFPFTYAGQQLRLCANIDKKIVCLRGLLINFNETKNLRQMSESLQPTLNHVSYGGQFEIATDDENPGHERQKQIVNDETPGHECQKQKPDDENPGHERQKQTTDDKNPGQERQKQITNDENPGHERQEHTTNADNPGLEWWKQTTNAENPGLEWRKQTTNADNPGREWRKQTTNAENPGLDWRKQTTNAENPGLDWRKQTTNADNSGLEWRKRTSNAENPGHEWRKQIKESDSTYSTDKYEPHFIPPDFRVWEPVLKKSDTNDGNTFRFKILSYNVLAQYLLEGHPYLYTGCSPYNLKWKVRAARLYDEIMKLEPDIICLQEVQDSHLGSFYAKFEQVGYFGIFKQRTGHRRDGCAIYFKQSLFEMKDHVTVEFYQPELPLLNRDNIGIMAKLVPRNYPGPPLVVATTHLLYNPKRTDVRLAQIQVFLAEIDRFAFYNNGREYGHLPIILTGDFNSTPDSAVIKLLDRGHVSASPPRDSSDWRRIGVTDSCQHLSVYINRQEGRTTDFNMTQIYNSDYSTSSPKPDRDSPQKNYSQLFNSGVIGHSLNLTSAYNKHKLDGSYEATTFQDYWVTVDYIYFSCCSTLRLVERLRLPTALECDALGRLPNDVYASDHLTLAAIFELKPYKSSL